MCQRAGNQVRMTPTCTYVCVFSYICIDSVLFIDTSVASVCIYIYHTCENVLEEWKMYMFSLL